MKKIFFSILIIITCIISIGCSKKEIKTDNWKTMISSERVEMPEDALKAFQDATKEDNNYDVIALLGRQIVSGTNYMFLVVEEKTRYQILTIYKNLEDVSIITSKSNLDYKKYVNEDIATNREELLGGWEVKIPSKGAVLDEEVQTIFNNAKEKLHGIEYIPIATLGIQKKSGKNYALLCYGTIKQNNGIYLITLYEDQHNTQEIVSSAYINLGELS